MGSQNLTQNPKKGASRFRKHLPTAMWVVILVALSLLGSMQGDSRWWWGLPLVLIGATASGILLSQLERRDKRIEDLEAEMSSFPAQDFMEGMNQFGVEVLLGGAPGAGEWGPDIRLRFPATQLHKHLVDAMVHGFTAAWLRQDVNLSQEEITTVRREVEMLASRWIEEMQAGLR